MQNSKQPTLFDCVKSNVPQPGVATVESSYSESSESESDVETE